MQKQSILVTQKLISIWPPGSSGQALAELDLANTVISEERFVTWAEATFIISSCRTLHP